MLLEDKVVHIDHEYICTNRDNPEVTSRNGYQSHPVTQSEPNQKTVNLDGPPPILEISQLGIPGAVEVYALLFESAYKDRRSDHRKHLPWSLRQDSGATTEWSIKGIASQLKLGKEKVRKAIDGLLDHGFIRVLSFIPSFNGSNKRLFQVIRYNQLEAYRYALDVMGEPFGKTTSSYRPIQNYTDSPFDWSMDECIDAADEAGDLYQVPEPVGT